MSQNIIKELNAFLKGQYIGIHAYETFIYNAPDSKTKGILQDIQQDHKQHANKVAERIQNLGGEPVDDVGFVGSITEIINDLKGSPPETTQDIFTSALKGENYYGIQVSEEIVKGDLDPESKKIIEEILDEDRKHVKLLNKLIH